MSKHPVDIHVGQKIRHRRWLLGRTQQQLASAVGIKFQQIQKYESGANRVSASRLWDIANALSVPVSYFFDGLDGQAETMPQEPSAEDIKLAGRISRLPAHQRRSIAGLMDALDDPSSMPRIDGVVAAE